MCGQKYLVTGEIQLEIGLDGGEEISVDVLNRENAPIETTSAKFSAKDGDEKAIYEYSIWAGLGDDLVFIPHARYVCIILLQGFNQERKLKFCQGYNKITCFNKIRKFKFEDVNIIKEA